MRFNLNKGALVASNVTVRRLIWGAYDVSAFQIVGGPGWVDTEHYDINATAGQTGEISRERLAQMLKDLLANRFGLRLHSETRNLAAYALLIDKNVPKLTENTGSAVPGISMNEASGRAQIAATSVSMAKLAITLGNQLGRAVIDKTGMEGTYDFRLEWNPDQATASSAPSLFTALREQLGLRLESQKAQVEVLVIDNLEKPSQN
jgi:uncharacterized protein (TIGR03435 family)